MLARPHSKHTPPFLQSPKSSNDNASRTRSVLSGELLLWANVTVMSTLAFAAVGCLLGEIGVTLSANHLFALEFPSERGEIGCNLAGA